LGKKSWVDVLEHFQRHGIGEFGDTNAFAYLKRARADADNFTPTRFGISS
jgi:hypothetical protein